MNSLSVKEYLSLKMPAEDTPVSDHSRILLALGALGYDHVTIPLRVLRTLYPMCREANFDITVTLDCNAGRGRKPMLPSLRPRSGLRLHHHSDAAG